MMPGAAGDSQTASSGGVALGGRGVLPWRVLLALAALSLALGTALHESLAGRSAAPAAVRASGLPGSQRISREGLLSLPPAAQEPVSAALGGDSAAYRISASAGGFQAASPAQHLSSSFTGSGVLASSGTTRLGLSVRGIGYGSSLRTLDGVAPVLHGSRVLYVHPDLSEWYSNGPAGLEQGFTVPRAPAGHAHGPLTLSIALSGNAQAAVVAGGQSITLTRAEKTVLRYTGLSASDARGHALHSWLQLRRGRILLRVDASGARYPLRIDPLLQQGEKLTGGKEGGDGSFGYSVALSANGHTALIGGPADNGQAGAAWVFTRSGSTWTQQGEKLTGGAEEIGEGRFGSSVALSSDGDTALIGGEGDDGDVGAAWVFTRSGSTWTEQAKILAKGEVDPGSFGASVALSSDGTTALVGAPTDYDCVGAAWAFTNSGSKWKQEQEFASGQTTCPTPDSATDWGTSVALSADGETALVGGPPPGPFNEGGFWAFAHSGSTWTKQAEFEDEYGDSVALSADGDTALVGGVARNGHSGAAQAFTRSGSTWSPQGEEFTGEAADVGLFGTSVALSSDGDTALVGGPNENLHGGAAWAYTRENGEWIAQGEKLTGAKESGEGEFGYSVALSESADTALVGGPADNSSVGAAWVFVTGPTVTTGSASEVKPTVATLNATVNPNEEAVSTCKFEYGTTTSYGKSIACSSLPGSGASPVAVSASLGELKADTTYHFRISATNGGGTSHGADQTFTTLLTSASGGTTEETKPAEATDGHLSAIASDGIGTVTVGPYGADPGGSLLAKGTSDYVDVYRGTGSSFAKVEFKDCELGGGKSIWWDNPAGTWEPISSPTAVYSETPPPPCITVTITESTKPDLAQLTGTRFGTRFGDAPGSLESGKCEATKDGYYEKGGKGEEGRCLQPDPKNKGSDTKGKYEWYPSPVECFPKKDGYYSNATCTTGDEKKGMPKGKFEKGSDRFTGTGGVARFEITTLGTLECTTSESAGEMTGQKTGKETVTYKGCKLGSSECASAGVTAGTIETDPLEVFIEEEKQEVDTEFFQDPIMTFTCADEEYTLKGGARGETTGDVDVMSSTSASVFSAGVGEQELETVAHKKEYKTTMTASEVATGAQAIEINTSNTFGTQH